MIQYLRIQYNFFYRDSLFIITLAKSTNIFKLTLKNSLN